MDTSNNLLTDYAFWEAYWSSKKNLVFKVSDQFPFLKEIQDLIQAHGLTSSLEVGGFPGYYTAYLSAAHPTMTCALLDFFILPSISKELFEQNGCPDNIQLIQKDLFDEKTPLPQKADLVFSNGLIEHFKDSKSILEKHMQLSNDGGFLFITLPNFKSLNGWFQKTFDLANYQKHNIECMDLNHLRACCEQLGLESIQVRYHGGFGLWLEDADQKPMWVRALRFFCWFPFKVFFKLFPINSSYFAPNILLIAQKKK